MSNVKERLLKFIQSTSITTAEFERRIGVSGGYVSNISKSIQPDKLEKISKEFPELNINWLLLGDGPMKRGNIIGIDISSIVNSNEPTWTLENCVGHIEVPETAKEIVENIWQAGLKAAPMYFNNKKLAAHLQVATSHPDKEEQTRPRVPLTAAAGSLSGESIGITLQQCEQLPIIHQIPSYDFTMFIKGDSMSPRFESGDEIACRRIDQTRFIQWGKVHVLDTTQGFIIKRVYDDGNKIRCVSYNPAYADFSVPKEDIHSMSLVVGVVSVLEM